MKEKLHKSSYLLHEKGTILGEHEKGMGRVMILSNVPWKRFLLFVLSL